MKMNVDMKVKREDLYAEPKKVKKKKDAKKDRKVGRSEKAAAPSED